MPIEDLIKHKSNLVANFKKNEKLNDKIDFIEYLDYDTKIKMPPKLEAKPIMPHLPDEVEYIHSKKLNKEKFNTWYDEWMDKFEHLLFWILLKLPHSVLLLLFLSLNEDLSYNQFFYYCKFSKVQLTFFIIKSIRKRCDYYKNNWKFIVDNNFNSFFLSLFILGVFTLWAYKRDEMLKKYNWTWEPMFKNKYTTRFFTYVYVNRTPYYIYRNFFIFSRFSNIIPNYRWGSRWFNIFVEMWRRIIRRLN